MTFSVIFWISLKILFAICCASTVLILGGAFCLILVEMGRSAWGSLRILRRLLDRRKRPVVAITSAV